jgi:hypothetical protein
MGTVMLVHWSVERMEVQFRPGVGKKEAIVRGQRDHVGEEASSGAAWIKESMKRKSKMLMCEICGRDILEWRRGFN